MPLQTYSYSKASQLPKIIQNIISKFHGRENLLRFVVPSKDDKHLWPLNDSYNLWTWQDIYGDISSEKKRRVLSPPDHLLILKSILSSAINNHSDKVKSLPGLERSGFLTVLSDDIRELLNEAVKPEQLPSDQNSLNPSEFLLPEIYSDYLKYLDNNSLLDSAQVYTAAYNEILINQNWGRNFIVVFVGFLSFNHAQLELVKAVNDRCAQTVIIKPEANMSGFHDADSQLGVRGSPSKSSGSILEISSAEPGLEPEILARLLALWSAGKYEGLGEFQGFDSIGLMIDGERQDAFAEAFERYGIPYCFTEGISISRTLPGKILASLRHLNSKQFPAYDTAVLLTQPCFAGSKFPVIRAYRAGRSGLDRWQEYLAERNDDPDEKLHDVFHRALLAVKAIKEFCGSLSTSNTPLRIMRAFDEFLNTSGLWLKRDDSISQFPELDESMRLTASAIQTVSDKVLALSELMPDLGGIQDERLSGDEAFDFLEDWCRNSNTRRPIQLTNSVRVFTGQPPVLSKFPVWIMTGVTQKSWSPNMKTSPLLGNEERSKLRENEAYLPRTKEKAEQHEALFRRLVQTGEKLTIISRPLLDDEGRPVSESPFMQRFIEDMPEWSDRKVSSEGINILLGSDGFTFPEIDAADKVRREVPCVKCSADSVNASDIQELLECPFLWFQRRRAKLYQPDSEMISPAEWGNMLHKFWETVWKLYRIDMRASGSRFVGIAKSEWERLIHAEGEDYVDYSYLVKDTRLRRRLESIKFRAMRLALLQSEILEGLHNEYIHESILLEDEANLMYEIEGVKFFGKCDRIELLRGKDGAMYAFIADYKEGHMTSSSYDSGMKDVTAKSWNTKENFTEFKHGLQLSLYAAMFRHNYEAELSGVYILGHEDGRISGTFTDKSAKIFAGFTADGKADVNIGGRFEEGDYAMECAVRILKGGEFAPDYDSERCRNCRIKSVCRKGEFKGEVSDRD